LSSNANLHSSTVAIALLFGFHICLAVPIPTKQSNYFASAVSMPIPQSTGWYTVAQAAAGAKRYRSTCAGCHGVELQGGMGPALVGKQFWTAYGGKKLSTLWSTVHTEMPMMAPGSVSSKNSINIMAFLLQKNGVSAGTVPLDDSVDLSKVLPAK
jgi:mono/diheme cytochrome c family protein